MRFDLAALVEISPGHFNAGPLTNWTPEEEIFLQYLQNSVDSYSACLQKVWNICSMTGDTEPHRVMLREASFGQGELAQITPAQPLFRLRDVEFEDIGVIENSSCDHRDPVACANFMASQGASPETSVE